MKLKTFFKGQVFKCILVLLVIALISGGLLAIASDLLNVSEEERTSRAIKSVFGEDIPYETVFDTEKEQDIPFTSTEKGYIEKVYLLKNSTDSKNYLIKATGKEGYKSGTISLWVVVSVKETVSITSVAIAEYDKQTLMSKFDGKVLSEATDGNVVVSGATYSATAFNNALDAVNFYATNALIDIA